MNQLAVQTENKPAPSVFGAMSPAETVAHATQIANALAPVIEKQGMFSIIQGKKHPKVEAWLTLGAILGVLPREKSVTELDDGSYLADVELISTNSGLVIAGASSICGIEEKRWSSAERYARRSMAVTRATGKAYRLAFSWIIQLAGYQTTPAEEMPDHDEPKATVFDINSSEMQNTLAGILKGQRVPEKFWEEIAVKMHGRPSTDLHLVLKEVRTAPVKASYVDIINQDAAERNAEYVARENAALNAEMDDGN